MIRGDLSKLNLLNLIAARCWVFLWLYLTKHYHRLNFICKWVLVQVTCLMNLGGQFCFYRGLFLLFLSFKVLTRFSLFLFFCFKYNNMSNTNEVWLDIPEYEDEYQVSSLGRVLRKKTNEIKTPSHNRGNGLWNYKLSKNGVVKTYTAAKLVALAFIMNPNPKLYRYAICKNGDKNDYTVNNIIWATPRQCVEAKNKRFPELKGKFVYKGPPPTQKMNDVLIKQLLDLYSVGYSTRQLEDIFPIKKSRIASIVSEKASNPQQ